MVEWPKFGHSTTLNNKGYKAHREMGDVQSQAKFGENIRLTCPLSHELCKMVLSVFSPILAHTLMVQCQEHLNIDRGHAITVWSSIYLIPSNPWDLPVAETLGKLISILQLSNCSAAREQCNCSLVIHMEFSHIKGQPPKLEWEFT